ncbi:MAG: 30S ribosomal protein S13 [Candidatus Nomurabacteria bacterium]|nr:30S ribosomal protein S13 [Candidatus Nomurabacteria bacterium]
MRISGITLPDNKQLQYGLTAVYGVGLSRSQKIADQAKIDRTKKVADLTEVEEKTLRDLVEGFTIEGDLKREKTQNIKRLKDIVSYRGGRHSRNLPVNGQRTKTNSRTVRGNKRSTAGSGKLKVDKK